MSPLYRRPNKACPSCAYRRSACFRHQGLLSKWGDGFTVAFLGFMCNVPVWLSKG